MKKVSALIFVLSLLLVPVSLSFSEEAAGEGASAFQVERFVVAGSIDKREPVGIVDIFSSSTEVVYCFLEAREITEDTTVSFVWYYAGEEVARVNLPLREGKRWRTNSSKRLGGRQGEWRVELEDESGTVLEMATFTVE